MATNKKQNKVDIDKVLDGVIKAGKIVCSIAGTALTVMNVVDKIKGNGTNNDPNSNLS